MYGSSVNVDVDEYVCLCVHMCICVCIYICICVCGHVCRRVCGCICLCVCICGRVYKYANVYIYACNVSSVYVYAIYKIHT